jgi:hypothetical protein
MCPSGATRKVICIRHNMVENYTHSLTLRFETFWFLTLRPRSLVFCVTFCLFVFFLFHCLGFFDLRFLIIPLVSSNFSYNGEHIMHEAKTKSSDLWRHEASVGLWHTYVIYRTCHNHHIEIFVGIINNVFFLLNRTIKMFYHNKLHKQLKVLINNRCSGW